MTNELWTHFSQLIPKIRKYDLGIHNAKQSAAIR